MGTRGLRRHSRFGGQFAGSQRFSIQKSRQHVGARRVACEGRDRGNVRPFPHTLVYSHTSIDIEAQLHVQGVVWSLVGPNAGKKENR